MNEFKKQYKIPLTQDNIKSLQKSANQAIEKLLSDMLPFSNKEVQNYLHNVVAAIMLEHEKYYEGFDIKSPYRFKSEKSKIDKTIDFFSNESEIDYNDKNDTFNFSFTRDILDVFAMKIVATNNPPTFNSSDPMLKKLIKEKKENHRLLGKMQGFQFKLIDSEFENPPHYKYTVSKREYYENCKILLEQIKTLIAPEATKLHKFYNNQISSVNETIALLDSMGYLDNTISEKDFTPNSDINFLNILNDFGLRVHDKLNLAVLTKQIESIFKNSDVLKKLGVELLPGIKEKRTSSGYVSNFIYIKTLVGVVECQLQSEHEYKAGNYGYAAHMNMQGKDIKARKIPNIEDPKELEDFYNYACYISPNSYLAQLDNIEESRVVINKASEYQNYKNIIGQVPKNSKRYLYLTDYFDKLYPIRNQIFKNDGSELGIMRSDIMGYIDSEEFKNLLKNINKTKNNNLTR